MTNKKTNEMNATSQLREPKPKKKLGLSVPQIRMPHEEIIRSDEKPEIKLVPNQPEKQTLPSQTRRTTQSRQTRQSEIAPTKNFQKVPNSISKQAVPEGWFKGKSKQLYDALYSLTRGAVVPTRKIRIQKSRLMKLAGIGSRITFDSNIQHLSTVGLISEKVFAGEHEGNEFEVFMPEEVTLPSQSSQTTQSSDTSQSQKVDRLLRPESSQTSQSFESINMGDSDAPKTFFKTLSFQIDDDAPVIGVLEKLNEAARKVTGKDLTKKDLEKCGELAEILITETVIAAARTGSVSAFIPFMTENLRRRLYSKRNNQVKRDSRPVHLDVGRGSEPEENSWQPATPMNEEQRQKTLKALREAKAENRAFFQEFKTYGEIEYTAEDFRWLLENLEKE